MLGINDAIGIRSAPNALSSSIAEKNFKVIGEIRQYLDQMQAFLSSNDRFLEGFFPDRCLLLPSLTSAKKAIEADINNLNLLSSDRLIDPDILESWQNLLLSILYLLLPNVVANLKIKIPECFPMMNQQVNDWKKEYEIKEKNYYKSGCPTWDGFVD